MVPVSLFAAITDQQDTAVQQTIEGVEVHNASRVHRNVNNTRSKSDEPLRRLKNCRMLSRPYQHGVAFHPLKDTCCPDALQREVVEHAVAPDVNTTSPARAPTTSAT